MKNSIRIIFFVLIVSLNITALAVPLTDGELYFDPAAITPDYYTRIELPDLGFL